MEHQDREVQYRCAKWLITNMLRYLTNQCEEIDSMMKRTLMSIDEYKKLKQTIITNATTKGIRENVKMKASGIEWVEEIPENWEVLKFKYLATDVFKGAGITKEDVKENGEIPCVRYGEIYTQYNFHFDECKSTATYMGRL